MSAFTKFYGDVTWANSASAKAITCTARRIHREICELSIRPGSAHHSRQNRCSKQNSLPRRDRVEDARACHSAEHLRDDVRQQVRSREPFARHQPTALPHPPNTTQNVPKNSAAARFPILNIRLLKLEFARLARVLSFKCGRDGSRLPSQRKSVLS